MGVASTIHDKIELRGKAKERTDEIEKLRKKREIELENLFNIDNEAIDLLIELDIDKKDRQEELIVIEIKLEKSKISEKQSKQLDHKLSDISK